jgi:hypothetical protein
LLLGFSCTNIYASSAILVTESIIGLVGDVVSNKKAFDALRKAGTGYSNSYFLTLAVPIKEILLEPAK